MGKRTQKKIAWTAEDRARHKAIREQFASRPTIEELEASGELVGEEMTLATFREIDKTLNRLKKAREQAGLSLTDLAQRTGMDKATLSRLENGRNGNPTLETLSRIARALGKEIVLVLRDQGHGD